MTPPPPSHQPRLASPLGLPARRHGISKASKSGSQAMSSAENSNMKSTSDVSSDRLSDLPPEMKGNILSCLSVQDAVRTSILSSAWRNAWTTMPEIILCDDSFKRSTFIKLVNKTLSLHKGHLDTCRILGKNRYRRVFKRWMRMMSRRSPSSITIELTTGLKYKIPSSLFSVSDLKYLCLENCVISLPPVFKGFKRLIVLKMKDFSSTDSDIENFILCCPILSSLKFETFEGLSCLNIRAPQLKWLVVDGKFEDIHLDAPNLQDAYFSLEKSGTNQTILVAEYGKNYLKQALGSLRGLTALRIDDYFLAYLSKGWMLPAVFDGLERIFLDICFCYRKEVLTAFSLFQNSPILKEIGLSSAPCDEGFGPMRMWDQHQASIRELTLQMDHLVMVRLDHFADSEDYEVDFIGKLLSCAPVLEEVKVNSYAGGDCSTVLEKLLALPRASQKAKISIT